MPATTSCNDARYDVWRVDLSGTGRGEPAMPISRGKASMPNGWRNAIRRQTRRHPIGASRLSCYPSPGVGNEKHRPPPSPPLPLQGGASKQVSDPISLFAGSVSTRCARRDRPEAGLRPRYRKFESVSLQRRVSDEPSRRLSIRTAPMDTELMLPIGIQRSDLPVILWSSLNDCPPG